MKTPLLTLGALAALTVSATTVHANPLDPLAFTSLGTPVFTPGTYFIETTADNTAPTITNNLGTVLYTGVFSGSGTAAVAVFDFSSLNIASGVVLQGVNDANSRPFALLSQSNFTLAGSIVANGSAGGGGGNGAGGAAGPGGGGGGAAYNSGSGGAGLAAGGASVGNGTGGNGGGPGGAGRTPSSGNGAGGGFGGAGGNDFSGTSPVGGTYGDLTQALQGGSGGGGSSSRGGAAGGGGGGGGLELGADGALTITGTVSANGGGAGFTNGGVQNFGGNGSGGGLLLHAPMISLAGTGTQLSAAGGAATGSQGGGGRIAIGTLLGTGPDGTNAAGLSVAGANPGTITNFQMANPVPEPSTWAMVAGGTLTLAAAQRARRRS